ncbi:hypothetical protein ME763_10710 [Streptomyces murinus]|uniref:hypothetical protein n=1 Tax=Streptomyces murinus TaxID=33900 RepID=UPI000A1F0D4D|nr:hypothetical protein [Streptomyces murinus]WDO06105.1 hypothetical protein ME763_10710 [Streptomyces murinus]
MVPRSLFWVAVVVVAGGGYDVVGVVLGAPGGAELDELGEEPGADVGGRVVEVLGGTVVDVLGGALGVELGGADGEGAGLVLGRGPGAPGSTWVCWCGHRSSPRPSPATTAAEPAAR